jgi:predicted RNA-binding Zn ribbon-like protein
MTNVKAAIFPREDLCLDFSNTRSWRGSEWPTERLTTIADLFAWVSGTGTISADLLQHFETMAPAQPALFADAIGLRESIYRSLDGRAQGRIVDPADFSALATRIAASLPRNSLAISDERLGWHVTEVRMTAEHLLSPVLWSLADLLMTRGVERIRRCVNEACLWLFRDDSKNGTRRWCDMATCGNRAKAKRHYKRARSLR